MKNEIEVIDGVKGEWRTVTKPSEVKVGQRVRYDNDRIGYSGLKRYALIDGNILASSPSKKIDFKCWNNLFDGTMGYIQAFFPLPVKRKVAKVEIKWIEYDHPSGKFKWEVIHAKWSCRSRQFYTSRKSALRGARRFCKAIGYECEIVK